MDVGDQLHHFQIHFTEADHIISSECCKEIIRQGYVLDKIGVKQLSLAIHQEKSRAIEQTWQVPVKNYGEQKYIDNGHHFVTDTMEKRIL